MPKLRPQTKRLDSSVEVMHQAHAHWLAIGWLVARESGIEPPTSPLCGQTMARWDQTRNLPSMLKVYRAQAQLMYRIRRLCLLLHEHRNSTICGGPEQWWQRILEEDILGAICDRLAPEVMPEVAAVDPPTRAASSWWMRRGINPVNAQRRPATWALIEAVQGRCYPTRVEALRPSDDVALPIAALNGAMSLTRRKTLLKDITGSIDGWSLAHNIEITRDWLEVLNAWQLTAKDSPKKIKSQQLPVEQLQRYEAIAPLIHNALMPSWWANQSDIFHSLELISENKLSHCNGFDALKQFEEIGVDNTCLDALSGARIHSVAKKKEPGQSANPTNSSFAIAPQRGDKTSKSLTNPVTRFKP